MKGNLIIISSPSGGGKGTLIREVLATVPSIGYSVSYTTRPMRRGEENGRDYYFVTTEEFNAMRARNEFLEWASVHDNFYGTARSTVDSITSAGQDVILEIDVQGARSIMEIMPGAVSVFIMPPSFDVLKTRLTNRATESSGELAVRLRNSFDEVREYEWFQYVVINKELFAAAHDLKTVIFAERLKRVRQTEAIQDILSNFDVSNYKTFGE